MPIYKVTENDQPARLVKATSASAAIRHAASQRFAAETMKNPVEVAEMMSGGTQLETATPIDEETTDGD
jgi:hypothetical protein